MDGSRPDSGSFALRPDPGRVEPVRAPAPTPSSSSPIERVARIARRRGRFALAVLGGLVVVDALFAGNWARTQRAQATVLVDPARSLDAELRAHLPALPERLGALLAQATADAFLEGELLEGSPELAEVHWLDDALEPRSASARAERLRERISVAVEGPERSPVIRVSVRGERAADVALVASRVAGRLVALDRAFRSEDARARRDGAAHDPALDPAPLARAEAELEAFRRDDPRVGPEGDGAVRAQLAELETREAQDASLAAELASSIPLLEAEEAQRHSALLDEAESARRSARAVAPGASRVATVESATPAAADEARDPALLGAPGYAAWREARARLEAARVQEKATRARALARGPELARARDLARRWPELRARLARLEGERDRAAAALEAARRRVEVAVRLASVELGTAADGARLERLVLADPPVRLEPPEGPERALVFLVGLGLSALAAGAAAVWRELRDRSLHTSDDAARALGVPVLGTIPRLRGRRS